MELEQFIKWLNTALFWMFMILYGHQYVYLVVALFKKPKQLPEAPQTNRYCVLIAARNEEKVIGNLIRSVQEQTYPKEYVDICVVADNCTDETAAIARAAGAYVVERQNRSQVGKGYALNHLLKHLPVERPDAYLIFDADNILDPHYIEEMNKVYAAGYLASTSYRNSCNYGSNWISAGYAQWFIRESRYLNQARMQLGTSCAISGTGFMVADSIIQENEGWIHHLLTEDIEFSVDAVLHGVTIGYCKDAIVYDEQPTTFRQSWTQRLRWCKGFYQVLGKYGTGLIQSAMCKRNFAAYDMLMAMAPAALISMATLGINTFGVFYGVLQESASLVAFSSQCLIDGLIGYYRVFFMIGTITMITEWKKIQTTAWKKILYSFTFPLFMFTYVPIAIAAFKKNVTWSPIAHKGYEVSHGYQKKVERSKLPMA